MGHIRLGTLPKTQKWQRVVGLIAGGADVERIAAASADAAEHGLERASQDQGLAHAFWLLTQIPQAARQSDFADQLKRLGLEVSCKPTLLEIVGAFTNAVDRYVSTRGKRSDLGEMAQHAAAETLTTLAANYRASLDQPLVMSNKPSPSLARRIDSASSHAISFLALPAARSGIFSVESYRSMSARINGLRR